MNDTLHFFQQLDSIEFTGFLDMHDRNVELPLQDSMRLLVIFLFRITSIEQFYFSGFLFCSNSLTEAVSRECSPLMPLVLCIKHEHITACSVRAAEHCKRRKLRFDISEPVPIPSGGHSHVTHWMQAPLSGWHTCHRWRQCQLSWSPDRAGTKVTCVSAFPGNRRAENPSGSRTGWWTVRARYTVVRDGPAEVQQLVQHVHQTRPRRPGFGSRLCRRHIG